MTPPVNRRGAAMIIVACVLAVILALSLSLLFSVSRLLAGVETKRDNEQSRILAVSLSQELERQLTQPKAEEKAEGSDSLWRYVRDMTWGGGWTYFNEDESGHGASSTWRSFTIPADAAGAEAELLLYWTSDAESYNTGVKTNTTLVARVSCAVGGQESILTSEFSLSCTEISEGDPPVVYEDWQWSLMERE